MVHPYYRSSKSTSLLLLSAKLISALAAVVADPPSSPLPSLSDWLNLLLLLIFAKKQIKKLFNY